MKILQHFKSYIFPALLFTSLIAGCLTGFILGNKSQILKPLGDIFINLLFTAVVPLIFFSVASAVSHLSGKQKLLKMMSAMLGTFIFTGIIAAIFMTVIITLFPPAQGVALSLDTLDKVNMISLQQQIVGIFTVSNFSQLFSHEHILPLIIFSLVVGLATSNLNDKGRRFSTILQSGADIFMQVINYIMYLAPIGFFAYFATLIGELGPQLMTNYFRVFIIYYSSALLYFILAFSFYAYLSGGINKIKIFWQNVLLPMLTALATCSSAASIPANLQAAKEMKISEDVYETVIPMGAMIHKDGSVLGAIVKIAFLFGIYGMPFSGTSVILTALLIALLVGTVMGGIPSGGMLGEMLIISLYGFPPQALIMIAAISILIDPLATMLNVTGDGVCALMVERIIRKEN